MGQALITVICSLAILLLIGGVVGYLIYLIIKALIKYTKSEPVRKEKAEQAKTLGEVIKKHRLDCKMTQQFVAEALASADRRYPNGKAAYPIQAQQTSWHWQSFLSWMRKIC